MKMKFTHYILLVSALLLSGCAQKYGFRVDALSRDSFVPPPQANVSFVIQSGDPAIDVDDLRFAEVSSLLVQAMKQAGYRQGIDANSADLIILVDASISDPLTTTRRYSEPYYHHRGGYNRVVRQPVRDESGQIVRYVYSNLYIPPRSQFAGYVSQTESYTEYEKVLYLSAREAPLAEGEPGTEVWTVTVKSKDTRSDLRAHLPFMIKAAEPYFGKRTEGEIEIVLEEDDLQGN